MYFIIGQCSVMWISAVTSIYCNNFKIFTYSKKFARYSPWMLV